jgi:hypothetical protein
MTADEKGPAERPVEGGNEADGPFSPAAYAGSRSYIPYTSAPWKRATWLVGGSASV